MEQNPNQTPKQNEISMTYQAWFSWNSHMLTRQRNNDENLPELPKCTLIREIPLQLHLIESTNRFDRNIVENWSAVLVHKQTEHTLTYFHLPSWSTRGKWCLLMIRNLKILKKFSSFLICFFQCFAMFVFNQELYLNLTINFIMLQSSNLHEKIFHGNNNF